METNTDKYPRTYHFPFSHGATKDDLIAKTFERIVQEPIVITEKLDGENTCINESGVFSRSHVVPCTAPWSKYLWKKWENLEGKLKGLEIFGENLYAVHSIEYSGLKEHFFVFAIRENDKWYSWEDVEFYARLTDLSTVPVLFKGLVSELLYQADPEMTLPREDNKRLEEYIIKVTAEQSALCDPEIFPTPKEGLVIRIAREFANEEFPVSVFKWVRPHHVQSEEHWRKNWRRAFLNYELNAMKRIKE